MHHIDVYHKSLRLIVGVIAVAWILETINYAKRISTLIRRTQRHETRDIRHSHLTSYQIKITHSSHTNIQLNKHTQQTKIMHLT